METRSDLPLSGSSKSVGWFWKKEVAGSGGMRIASISSSASARAVACSIVMAEIVSRSDSSVSGSVKLPVQIGSLSKPLVDGAKNFVWTPMPYLPCPAVGSAVVAQRSKTLGLDTSMRFLQAGSR